MLSKTTLFTLLMICTLIGCDNKPAKSKIENPLADQAEALEKAKNVEQKLFEAQQKTLNEIEKATN